MGCELGWLALSVIITWTGPVPAITDIKFYMERTHTTFKRSQGLLYSRLLKDHFSTISFRNIPPQHIRDTPNTPLLPCDFRRWRGLYLGCQCWMGKWVFTEICAGCQGGVLYKDGAQVRPPLRGLGGEMVSCCKIYY